MIGFMMGSVVVVVVGGCVVVVVVVMAVAVTLTSSPPMHSFLHSLLHSIDAFVMEKTNDTNEITNTYTPLPLQDATILRSGIEKK